ncbi:MAG: short-chain dehydrogenase [Fibrobacteres bacterium]|nr:short-chain dehydrogenase [Fibrobacterota bacterium]
MSQSLAGRHIVITGAGGGLGPAVVEGLIAAGAICHGPTRQEVDLGDEKAVARYYATLPPLWASVHVAGGFSMAAIADTTLEEFEAQWRINTVTAFLACREAVRRIRATGQGGRIVNVAARAAVEHPGGKIAYVTAKSALAGMTLALAAEIRSDRILVNAVLPDTIDTPANRAAMPDADHSRWTPAASIARAITWLASPENETVTGTLLPV